MSTLKKYQKKKRKQGVFAVVAGLRLSGKSTIAGSLPGKTAYLQADLWETGSDSALKLAKKLGNDLTEDDIVSFESLSELVEIMGDLATDKTYDNIYIDGMSAISEMVCRMPEVAKTMKKNNWDGFREVKEYMSNFLIECKKLAEHRGKNVFVTLALTAKHDTLGNVTDLVPDCKGNAYLSFFTAIGRTVVCTNSYITEEGEVIRELITKNDGTYSARIDSLLDDENPGIIRPASLASVINLIKGV